MAPLMCESGATLGDPPQVGSAWVGAFERASRALHAQRPATSFWSAQRKELFAGVDARCANGQPIVRREAFNWSAEVLAMRRTVDGL